METTFKKSFTDPDSLRALVHIICDWATESAASHSCDTAACDAAAEPPRAPPSAPRQAPACKMLQRIQLATRAESSGGARAVHDEIH